MSSDASIKHLLDEAQNENDEAINTFLDMFKPIIYKNSVINGYFNEDWIQELSIKLIYCIKIFKFISISDVTIYFD